MSTAIHTKDRPSTWVQTVPRTARVHIVMDDDPSRICWRAFEREAEEEPTMIPDYLIIDEIRRRQEDAWEPEPLRIPLYVPQWPQRPEAEEDEAEEPSSRVIIIDMVGGESDDASPFEIDIHGE